MEKLLELIAKLGPSLAPGGGAADYILGLLMKYGPALLLDVVEAMEKKNLTVSDVEGIFSNVKPYSAFGIPAPAASAPAPALMVQPPALAVPPPAVPGLIAP